MIRQLWRMRELLLCLVRRDLIVRYQSSVLGFLWSFARPLALVVIFSVAFSIILRDLAGHPTVPFGLHLLVGILVWTYFAGCVAQGHGAVLAHANLVKKVKLPIEVFPTATVVGNLINFLLGMVVVFPILIVIMDRHQSIGFSGVAMRLAAFVAVTALLTVLAHALTLIVSAVNVYFRDIESLSDVGLQAWFYFSPIVYRMNMLYDAEGNFDVVSERFPRFSGFLQAIHIENLYWLNPMTPICVAYRRILLYRPLDPGAFDETLSFRGLEAPDAMLLKYLAIAAVLILLLELVAQALFRRFARHFADEV